MAKKELSTKDVKKMQKAHIEFREEVGEKILTRSKIKEYFKQVGRRCDAKTPEAVADAVYKMLWKSITRCDDNNRGTVRPSDI